MHLSVIMDIELSHDIACDSAAPRGLCGGGAAQHAAACSTTVPLLASM
jgi:hypothetical protein